MADISYTLLIEEKLKDEFEKRANLEQRTIAGQIRFLMTAYLDGRIDIREPEGRESGGKD